MSHQLRGAGIIGLGMAVPDRVLTNHDLEKMVDTNDEWILTRTGISERRILETDKSTSDIATDAAIKALASAGLAPVQVDLIIVATCTPDMIFPSTASLVQERIGATNAGAFDLSAACSGLIYALDVASQFVRTSMYNHVLVIGAESLSRIVDWTDRSTCVLFGDGAAAVVVGPVPEGEGFLSFELGSDGRGSELLKIEAGGSRMPASIETVTEHRHTIKMVGKEVFRFAVTIIEDSSRRVLKSAGLEVGDIDLFVPHQANSRIMDLAAKRLGIDPEKVFSNVNRYGNTSSASVGIALSEAYDSGIIKPGHILVLVGFGGGLSWAASVVRWSKT